MAAQTPQRPVCQSCAMPMQRDEEFGTSADGSRCEEYCTYCYQQGRFTAPDMTVGEMVEHVAAIGVQKLGMSEDQARAMAGATIPRLRRWLSG